jgi:hypothetical protein
MAIQTFTSGQVLTAAQVNNLQANDYNQTVSTKTANYTLVAADKGTRVVMNVSSASTVTVNDSLFSAGDTLVIQNIATDATVVTAGTATVSTAGSLSIPQYGSGTLYFTSASAAIFFPSAGPAPSSGLTFIKSTAFSGTTATITNCFSATYTAYRVYLDQVDLTVASANAVLRLQFGATTSNYSYVQMYANASATWTFAAGSASTSFIGLADLYEPANPNDIILDITNPFTSLRTSVISLSAGYGANRDMAVGSQDSGTSFTDLKLSNATSTNMTGTVRVYGLADS